MMRALLCLVAVSSVSGAINGECALNGARAVDDMLDSAVYIMASIVRCDAQEDDSIRCALDVSSSVESVNAMIDVILKAVQQCGGLQTHRAKCGMAVGVLTRSMAGLSAASAGIVAKCPNSLNGGAALDTVGTAVEDAEKYGGRHAFKTAGFQRGFGQCVINIKDSVKSLFKAIKRIMTVKENCAVKGEECALNEAKIVTALTGLAEFVAGAIGKCSASGKHQADALCVQMSVRLFHAIGNLDRAGTAMSKECAPEPAELYALDHEVVSTPKTNDSSLTLALAALLPITAVVAFVGGKRLSKARSQPADEELAQPIE